MPRLKFIFIYAFILFPPAVGQSPYGADVPNVPAEVKFKSGYINPDGRPPDFKSALLWGIAIADTRVPGYESATVEIASTELVCRVNGNDVVMNNDGPGIRGGLYQRYPWFASDRHEPLPLARSDIDDAVILQGRAAGGPSMAFLERLSEEAHCQMANWRVAPSKSGPKFPRARCCKLEWIIGDRPPVPYGAGGNNHEAGASDWYFPSPRWQDATFTDLPHH